MHPIKLDWTQTGLQTFGGETITNAKLILKPADFVLYSSNTTTVMPINTAETSIKPIIPSLLPQENDSNDSSSSPLPDQSNIKRKEDTTITTQSLSSSLSNSTETKPVINTNNNNK